MDPQRIPQSFQIGFDPGHAVFELVVLGHIQSDFLGFLVEVEEELAIPHVVQDVFLSQK